MVSQPRVVSFVGVSARRALVALPIPLLLLSILSTRGQAADQADQQAASDMRESLSIAYEQWQSDVIFTSTFRSGRATVELDQYQFGDEITEEVWKALLDPTEVRYTNDSAVGVFHKSSELMRYRLDYEADPVPISRESSEPKGVKTPGLGRRRNNSHDEVANSVARIDYNFPQPETTGSEVDALRFNLFADTEVPEKFLDRLHVAPNQLNPLSLLSNSTGRPLTLWGSRDSKDGEEVELIPLSEERLIIRLGRTGSPRREQRWVTFWMEPEMPVVERIHTKSYLENGDFYLEKDIRCFDFVKCPGGMVPKMVVSASFRPTGPVQMRRWKSEDLGDRSPVDDDFILSTNPKTVFYGVANVPPVDNDQRRVDLKELAKQGYTETAAPLIKIDGTKILADEQRRSWFMPILLLNLVIIAGLSIWVMRRRA